MPIGEDSRFVTRRIFFITAIPEIDLEAFGSLDVFRVRLDGVYQRTIQDTGPLGRTSKTAAPAPTTQGMSSDRAMIAVCAGRPAGGGAKTEDALWIELGGIRGRSSHRRRE